MTILIRVFLGLFLLAMGANKFLNFLPSPDLSSEGSQFMMALAATGYMIPMVAITEIICGVLLMGAATAPFAAILMAPLSINIVAFHMFLAPESMLPGLIVFSVNLILGVLYFDYYRSIFAKIFTEKVLITSKSGDTPRAPIAVVNS